MGGCIKITQILPLHRKSKQISVKNPKISSFICIPPRYKVKLIKIKMSEYVPIEIQAEILKKLPVKPLLQFRSVSKPWKSLIDSRDFIVSYGVRHPQPHRFILRYGNYDPTYLSLVDNDDHSFAQQEFVPTVPAPIYALSVVGSSHGLLCLRGCCYEYRRDMFLLWNPSIRKFVGIQGPDKYQLFNNVGAGDVIGFGVCPVTFDPTILKIKRIDYYKSETKDMPSLSLPWKVRVFTLSTGIWSILSTNLPRESIILIGSQVVIDRFIYWDAFDMLDAEEGQSHCLIMSFDLTAKEFKEINLTGSLSNRLYSIKTISKLRESLVVLGYHREFEEDKSVYCLWMMMEQGVSRSFTKLFTINLPDARINQILGFSETGELIMETRDGYKQHAEVQFYDPNSKAMDNLGIDGEDHSFFMCSYMETLFLLDQLDHFIYWISN